MMSVKCPNCGNVFEPSEADRHELEESIKKASEEKFKKEIENAKTLGQKQAEEKYKEENKALEEKLAKEQKDRQDFEKKVTEQAAKKAGENVKKIKEEADKEADEKHRLEKLEWEKQKADMQKTVEALQRQGKQGSQQLQGDVLEKDLEERLADAFPNDDFRPVPTGVKGGDIVQEVRNKHGNTAGLILWEAKRTKEWKKDWLTKLKEDMRSISASDCILVTDAMPPHVKIYDRIENVWVTSYEYSIKLASVVRFGLLNVAIARSSASHTDEQLKELYTIITSDSFRQMFEARDEIISALKVELEADKRSAEKRWKRQGAYIEKLDRNNSRLYGELQAHIPSLKPLKEPNVLGIEDGSTDNDQESLL